MLRAAVAADVPAIVSMVRAQCREEQPALAFSASRARGQVLACLEHGGAVMSEMDGAAVATCGVAPDFLPFSHAAMLRVLWCFVRLDHRRTAHMRDMLGAVKAMAAAAGLPLSLDCPATEKTQGKIGLLRRELGDEHGITFLVRG